MSEINHHHWDLLWPPLKSMETHYNKYSCGRTKSRIVRVWKSFDDFELPMEVDWGADPFENITWKLYFNSLNWLYSLLWGIDNEGDDPTLLHSHFLDYCRYLEGGDVNDMAWFDHATSDRLCFVSMLLSHPSAEAFSVEDRTLIDRIVTLHIEKIRGFYDSKFWFENNHGVFHALSLINISHHHPNGPDGFDVRELGIQYMKVSLNGILSIAEGMSLEQSFYYHQLALDLLDSIPPHAMEKMNLDLEVLIERMKRVNSWITFSGRKMPAIGDTSLIAHVPSEYMPDTDSAFGLKTFIEGGLSIVKEVKDDRTDHLTMLHRKERAAHGHFDALSITLSHADQPFIIDSGGPYRYGDELRFTYFMSSLAHNVVLINGKPHKSGAEFLESKSHGDGMYSISALHRGYDPVIHRRHIVYISGCGVMVLDSIEEVNTKVDLEILWHIHPDCMMEVNQSRIMLKSEGESMVIHPSQRIQESCSVQSGVLGDSPQGWATRGIAQKEAISTIIHSLSTDSPITIGTFFQFGDQPISLIESDGGSGFTVIQGSRRIELTITEDEVSLHCPPVREE